MRSSSRLKASNTELRAMHSLGTVMKVSIRLPILQGIIYEIVAGDPGTALERYSRAYRLISLARSKWPDQKDTIGSLKHSFCKCFEPGLDVSFSWMIMK